jgi:hypothetical protein
MVIEELRMLGRGYTTGDTTESATDEESERELWKSIRKA